MRLGRRALAHQRQAGCDPDNASEACAEYHPGLTGSDHATERKHRDQSANQKNVTVSVRPSSLEHRVHSTAGEVTWIEPVILPLLDVGERIALFLAPLTHVALANGSPVRGERGGEADERVRCTRMSGGRKFRDPRPR